MMSPPRPLYRFLFKIKMIYLKESHTEKRQRFSVVGSFAQMAATANAGPDQSQELLHLHFPHGRAPTLRQSSMAFSSQQEPGLQVEQLGCQQVTIRIPAISSGFPQLCQNSSCGKDFLHITFFKSPQQFSGYIVSHFQKY